MEEEIHHGCSGRAPVDVKSLRTTSIAPLHARACDSGFYLAGATGSPGQHEFETIPRAWRGRATPAGTVRG
jgi:hypothetical protein